MCYNKKTLSDWAYSCMPPEKAKNFLKYFEGHIYKIGEDKRPYLIKNSDMIPESHFRAYYDDFERCMTSQQFEY